LRTYARRAVLRTPPFLVERLRCVERLEALKARHPFLKPIRAYFLGSPGLGTSPIGGISYLTYLGALDLMALAQCLHSTRPVGDLFPIYDLVQASHLIQYPPALLLAGTERLTLWTGILLSWSIMDLPFMFTPGAS